MLVNSFDGITLMFWLLCLKLPQLLLVEDAFVGLPIGWSVGWTFGGIIAWSGSTSISIVHFNFQMGDRLSLALPWSLCVEFYFLGNDYLYEYPA